MGESFGLAVGFSDRELKTPMKPNNRMLADSVGKTFAAATSDVRCEILIQCCSQKGLAHSLLSARNTPSPRSGVSKYITHLRDREVNNVAGQSGPDFLLNLRFCYLLTLDDISVTRLIRKLMAPRREVASAANAQTIGELQRRTTLKVVL